MEPIIIDTDAGDDIDDAIAIAFAARRPELNLLGVTAVTYDAPRRAALVRQVLDAVGRPDVPVAAGAQFPLKPMTPDQRTDFMRDGRMNHCPPEVRSPEVPPPEVPPPEMPRRPVSTTTRSR